MIDRILFPTVALDSEGRVALKMMVFPAVCLFTASFWLFFFVHLAVNGGYSQWTNFTECSVSCGGGGIQSRSRTCTNPVPCCGGMNCRHLGPSTETKECGNCACGNKTNYFNHFQLGESGSASYMI